MSQQHREEISKLEARRDELQGDRADFLAQHGETKENEARWNALHWDELKDVLDAIDAAGGVP